MKFLGSNSRSSKTKGEDDTSSVGSSNSDSPKDEIGCNPAIKDLASAILQIEQSLEPKFLKRPLGSK
jgi:hypothetical protein